MGNVQIDKVDEKDGIDFVDELFNGIKIITPDRDIDIASGMGIAPSLRAKEPRP